MKTSSISERERKIGHRRVNEAGQVSYKKGETNALMGSIQLGIHDSVGGLAKYPDRSISVISYSRWTTHKSFLFIESDITVSFRYQQVSYILVHRDLLMQDFMSVETSQFPSKGGHQVCPKTT